jgi:hypothetical protein
VKLISDKKEFDTSSLPPWYMPSGDFFCPKFFGIPQMKVRRLNVLLLACNLLLPAFQDYLPLFKRSGNLQVNQNASVFSK